jgi:hypothetical protein
VYQIDPTRILGQAVSTSFWETVGILDELESTEIPPASWGIQLLPDGLRRDLSGSQNAVETLYLGRERTSTVLGEVPMCAQFERYHRDRQSSPFTQLAASSTYSGPLFVYAVSTESETGQRVLEPRAPVTLAWTAESPDTPAVACGTTFHQYGWTGGESLLPVSLPQGHRHVLLTGESTPRVSGFDESVSTAPEAVTPRQWHCRLFDIPDSMDEHHDIAGAAHWDQLDHGQFAEWFGDRFSSVARILRTLSWVRRYVDIGGAIEPIEHALVFPNWRLSRARDEVCALDPFDCERVHVDFFETWSVPFDGEFAIISR